MGSFFKWFCFVFLALNFQGKDVHADFFSALFSRAVVILDDSTSQCGTTVDSISGLIYSHASRVLETGNYGNDVDCLVTIEADDASYNLGVRVLDGDGAVNLVDAGDCLTISAVGSAQTDSFCGTAAIPVTMPTTLPTSFTVRLATDSSGTDSGFALYYYSYRDGTGGCTNSEFFCAADNTCLPDELTCDGYDNCSDGEDEEDDCSDLITFLLGMELWKAAALLAGIFGLLLIITIVCCCCCCKACCKRCRKQTPVMRVNA